MSKRAARTALAVLCLFALLLADVAPYVAAPPVSAVTEEDIEKKKKEKKELERQKAELQQQLESIRQSKGNALAQKENLDTQIAIIRLEISNTEELITQYEGLIEHTEADIAETQRSHKAQYELFCARVRAMEERGTISYWSVLFHSTSFADLLASIDFINEIMESDQRVIENLRETEEKLAQQQAQLENELTEQQEVRDELSARNAELKEQLLAAQALIEQLAANEAEYQKLIHEKEAAAEREQEEILRLSRELAEQQAREAAARGQQNAAQATKGGYIWPCSSNYVTSPLGSRYTGIAGASTNHMGIDIGRVGYTTQVVAAKAGTVIISDYTKYRGNYIVISHGSGNTTTYQHLSKRSASVGDKVAQGQVIGITGDTGVSRGAHLHFEIMENGQIVDPLKYLTNYVKGWNG